MVNSSRSGRAVGSRSPRRRSFTVTAARLAYDAYRIRVPPPGVSRPMCSCMLERLTWRGVWNRGGG